MNWTNSAIIPTLIGLFLFGVVFAALVYRSNGKHHGYTAFLVVIGVAVTVGATGPVIGWDRVIFLTLAFAASGISMIAGDIYREIKRRDHAERVWRDNLARLAERGITTQQGGGHEAPPTG
jgi:hypothetical protein